MEKILGIDTGTNSLGWAIVEKKGDDRYTLLDRGVNIFQEGVKIEKGIESSKAAERTAHKALRVRYYRIRLRKIELLHILSDNHLCPPLTQEQLSAWRHKKVYPKTELFMQWQSTDDKKDKNPYHDRYICLTQQLDLTDITQRYILGRALYHIIQRRGFLSNRKDKDDDEEGKVKEGISNLSKDMEAAGCHYLGEYFYHLYREGKKIRKHYTARNDHYLKEFEAICEKQQLDKVLIVKLRHAIFYQRPLKSQKGLVGHCVFEPKKTKCPASHPQYEEFRMLSFVNNVKVKTPQDAELRPLNAEERAKIMPLFFRKSKSYFNFEYIAKKLAGKSKYGYYKTDIHAPYLFNYYPDSNVSGCPVTTSLKSIFGEDWLTGVKEVYDKAEGKTDLQIINDVWHSVYSYSDKGKLKEFGKRHFQLTDEEAEAFANIRVDSSYAALSLKAIDNILPYLRRGVIYSKAVFLGNLKMVLPDYVWQQETMREAAIDRVLRVIDNYGKSAIETRTLEQCIKDFLHGQYGTTEEQLNLLYHPSMIEPYPRVPDSQNKLGSPRTDAIRNPMAMRSLFQMRHVINRLLAEGKIDRETTIHIEFARELNDANKRAALAQFTRDNQKRRDEYRKKIMELYEAETGKQIEPTDTEILKYQLWEEQDHQCVYTGKQIRVSDFVGADPKFDIEHTIPRSMGGDSTHMNLTLCDSRFNREVKKTLLPTQLSDYAVILKRVESWKKKYESLDTQIRRLHTNGSMDKPQKDRIIQKRSRLQMERDYWWGKYHRFEMTEVPEGFSRRQETDISVISRYGRLYLKSFFNRVFIVKGLATSDFRKIWGLQNIYAKKQRVNHIHHCIDAIVIACIGPGEYSKLAQYYHDEENHDWYGTEKGHIAQPWEGFAADINKMQDEILVAHSTPDNMAKQGRRRIKVGSRRVLACGDAARAQLHLDTYYGAIEKDDLVKYVVRKPLDSLKESDVKNIVDDTVRDTIERAIKEKGFKDAMSGTIWMNEEKRIPINKVRCYVPSITRPINIRQQRDASPKEYKRQYHVANDTNYAMAIYVGKDSRGKEKRAMETITSIDAAAFFRRSNDKETTGRMMFPAEKNGYPLGYILKKGTMVLLYENTPEEVWDLDHDQLVRRLYKVTGMSSMVIGGNTYGVINLLYQQEARPSSELKGKNGAYRSQEELRPKIVMLHTQIKALVEGVDFELNETGEIKRLI